jgi:hypothetical protein
LCFPHKGVTLALDFPKPVKSCPICNPYWIQYVATVGGAVYPAKDARMCSTSFKQYFPAWQAFEVYVDPRFSFGFRCRAHG